MSGGYPGSHSSSGGLVNKAMGVGGGILGAKAMVSILCLLLGSFKSNFFCSDQFNIHNFYFEANSFR